MLQLDKKTRDRLTCLIEEASWLGHTENKLYRRRAALAVRQLNDDYQIKLAKLSRALRILSEEE